MGPKPSKYLESSENTGGSLVRKRRGDQKDFSDNKLISEDDQVYQDEQDQEEEPRCIASNVVQETNTPSTSKRHGTGHYEVKRAQTSHKEVDDLIMPKKKDTLPPKSLPEQICTPVFLCQLFITIVCVLLMNYCYVYFLRNDILTTVVKGEHRLKELDTELGKVKQAVLDTKSLYEEYKHKVLQLDDIQSRMDIIQPNLFNKDSFITAFMILIVIVLLLAVFVYNLYQRSNNDIPGRTGGRVKARQNNNMGQHEVLRLIPVGEELEPGVCIISFDESRATTHKRILDSANIPNCKVLSHVIRRHEHIPKLPRCKVYLMCTEFSERHVIIEEQGKGLGDLHKTTYDAVMKLGGCLIILYTRDPGSRNLKDKVRYNERIYCVSNQPELAELNQDGSFFSVYDNLNKYQKTELRKKVTENIA